MHFIDYLDADRYVGLDIDDRIIAAGRDHLPADLVEAKRPVLEVISPESLARAAAYAWIFSNGFSACAAGPFDAYFTNLARFVCVHRLFSNARQAQTLFQDITMELTCKRWSRPAACS